MNNKRLAEKLQTLFIANKWTLSLAESCTGGAIAAELTKIAGCSDYFEGSFVTYSNKLKIQVLGVPPALIEKYGAVSREVAEAMVAGLLSTTNTEFGIAVTGIAGPGGATPNKPVGTVWIAIAQNGVPPNSYLLTATGTREEIIEKAVNEALSLLLTISQDA